MQDASKIEGSRDTMGRTGAGKLIAAMDLDNASGNVFCLLLDSPLRPKWIS
jgi:hypothetical protein